MANFLRFLLRSPSVEEERNWERENIRRKTERYLATNPLDRMEKDEAYRAKVEAIGAALEGITSPVLDIGGNTAGEATVLCQRCFRIVVSDINEYALDVSRQRIRKFALKSPWFVACDAHHLPFADGTFAAVTVIEALHHFSDYGRALLEIHRVLKPGGRFYSMEPNALNPLRRASEIRDRLRGTIEKSFTATQLRRLCAKAGFCGGASAAICHWSVFVEAEGSATVPSAARAVPRLAGCESPAFIRRPCDSCSQGGTTRL